jgi:hypothetical protein
VRPPVAMEDRSAEVLQAARGITGDYFDQISAESHRSLKETTTPTQNKHQHTIKTWREFVAMRIGHYNEKRSTSHEETSHFLDEFPGNPRTIDDTFKDGAPFPPNAIIEQFLAYKCETGTPIPRTQQQSLYNYVSTQLAKKEGLVRAHKEHHIPSMDIVVGELNQCPVRIGD